MGRLLTLGGIKMNIETLINEIKEALNGRAKEFDWQEDSENSIIITWRQE